MSNFGKFSSDVKLPNVDDFDNPFRLFNKDSDRNLLNIIDEEQFRLGGSPLLIYKYFQNIEIDDVYGEERNKLISVEPIKIYGHYDPKPVEENLSQFGLELVNNQKFTFNKSYVERRISRPIIPGI